MASSSVAPPTEDRNDCDSNLSLVANTDCSVCSNLAKDIMMINIGDLFRSVTTQACQGCQFLLDLSQQVHFSLRGHHLEFSQDIFVNWGSLYPPKEFLILPDRNPLNQHGKIEVFKTFPLGKSFSINLKPTCIQSRKANN
jgi:hypothetical protein